MSTLYATDIRQSTYLYYFFLSLREFAAKSNVTSLVHSGNRNENSLRNALVLHAEVMRLNER